MGLPGEIMKRVLLIGLAALGLAACETFPELPDLTQRTSTTTATTTTTPTVEASATPISATVPAAMPTPEQQLLDLERRLSADAQTRGLGGAMGPVMDPTDGFIVRPGATITGSDGVTRALGGPGTAPVIWQPDRVFISQSGDMAMTSGRYVQVLTGAEAAQGRYVVVWRKNSSGQWRILSESRTADPPRARRR